LALGAGDRVGSAPGGRRSLRAPAYMNQQG